MELKINKINKNAEAMVLFQVREGYLIMANEENFFAEVENNDVKYLYGEHELSEADKKSLIDSTKEVGEVEIDFDDSVEFIASDFTILEDGVVIFESVEEELEKENEVEEEVLDTELEGDFQENVQKIEIVMDVEKNDIEEEKEEIQEEQDDFENMSLFDEDVKEDKNDIEYMSLFDKNEVEELSISSEAVENVQEEEKNIVNETSVTEESTAAKSISKRVFPKFFGPEKDKKVEEFLKENEVSSEIIKWAMDVRRSNRDRVKKYPQMVIDVIPSNLTYNSSGGELEEALSAVLADVPLSNVGPTGVGKTTLITVIATLLNYPMFVINGNVQSNRDTFIGEYDIKEQGVISVKDGQMTKAALYGGILMIDEINFIRPEVLSYVNAFTDGQKSFQNDVRGETINLLPETRFACTMNVGSGYSGTVKMSKATVNRFLTIEFGYLSRNEIKSVIDNLSDKIDNEYLDGLSLIQKEQLIRLYGLLTTSAKNGTLPEEVGSVRSVENIAKMAPFIGLGRAVKMFVNNFDDPQVRAQVSGVITNDGLAEEIGFDPVEFNM